ncbi:MAG: hypothetical protein C0507_03740 [Cyanobacteria bacterium PR.3.49]|nr:hypothetical protein [Cyanobacteria bacterium PR.3.49]
MEVTEMRVLIAAVAALVITLTEGVCDVFAAESTDMFKRTVFAEAGQAPAIGSSQGYRVEDLQGDVLKEQNSEIAYNPASGVKVLTAYATLKRFGPDFQFETSILLDGETVDGVFSGDIFLEGSDQFFNSETLKQVIAALDENGIERVEGAVFVSSDFKFEGNAAGRKSAIALRKALGIRQKRAKLLASGVRFKVKSAGVKRAPLSAQLLAKSRSPKILALLKDMLSRSDNEMAATFGHLLGGPQEIAKTCRTDFELDASTLNIQTASGLGVNRVSPKAMIAALRGFKNLLAEHKLDLSDALPIAGVDHGTIFQRFADSDVKGVMVGKTGTLKQTDRGACVLVGEMRTLLRGEILFVVFQRGRNTTQLRLSQNIFVENLLLDYGGAGLKYAG